MTGVRNGPLARGITTAAGATVLGTVPPNVTWLLKAVHAYNANTTATSVAFQLLEPSSGVVAPLPTMALEPNSGEYQQVWTAMAPGDQFLVFSSAVGIHVWTSGAELPGVVDTEATHGRFNSR